MRDRLAESTLASRPRLFQTLFVLYYLAAMLTKGVRALTNVKWLPKALWLQGPVTKGYGRGSKKLGVPTANLPHFHEQLGRAHFERGVYLGWGCIQNDASKTVMPFVANIGVSPTFAGQENPVNIVEAHFLDCRYDGDFYDKPIRLSLVGFLRPEQKFNSLAELVAQIGNDMEVARQACALPLSTSALAAKKVSEIFLQRPGPWAGGTIWELAPV